MQHGFIHRRQVEFRDTDMAGIVHFSVYFTWMEEAEHAFMRSLELGVISEYGGHQISWPRVAAACNYRSAIRFEELVEVHLSIKRIGHTSVTYGHRIHRGDTLIADGSVTAVCCRIENGLTPVPVAIPNEFLEKLGPYVTGIRP